jgi:YVTN family beta-propeller protein
MDFRILGPMEVLDDDGHPVEVAAGRQRALLAVLLLHANEVVSVDRLIDALWGERPPETAAKALQGQISALRKALGPERVETKEPGYLFRIGADELDARRFEQLAATDPAAALAGWRGPALPEFAYSDFARGEIDRLEELRLGCVERRIDRDLAAGIHRELVPELEQLVAEHPLRERFRAQHMLALYRAGRQADALEAYRNARTALLDDLGIEPGTELRELEQAILRHDPALAAPPAAHVLSHARRRWPLVAATAAVVAGAVVAGLLATLGRSDSPGVVPNSVVSIDPGSNRLRDVIRVGGRPDQLVASGDALFVASPLTGVLTRVDTHTHAVKSVRELAEPSALAAERGRLWVGGVHSGTLLRFDGRSLHLVERVRLGGAAAPWLAVGGGSLWAVQPQSLDPAEERVVRINLRHPANQEHFRTGAIPSAVSYGGGSAWVSNFGSETISRIDAATGAVATFRVRGVADLEYGYGALWVLTSRPNAVRRIDPTTLLTDAILPVGRCPWQIAVGAGAVWSTNCHDGTVTRIDPAKNQVVATIRVGLRPLAVTVGKNRVWVGVAQPG